MFKTISEYTKVENYRFWGPPCQRTDNTHTAPLDEGAIVLTPHRTSPLTAARPVAMAQPITTRGAVLILVLEIVAAFAASLPAQKRKVVGERACL